MNDVPGADDPAGPAVGEQYELSVGGEINGLAEHEVAARKLGSHHRPDGRRLRPKLIDDASVIGQAGGQLAENCRQQGVSIIWSSTLDDRCRSLLALDRSDVDPDSDNDRRTIPRHEFGQNTRQLPGSEPLDDDQIIRPLGEHAVATEVVDCRSRRRAKSPDHGRGVSLTRWYAHADQQGVARRIVPRPVESPPSCGLVICDQDRSRGLTRPRLVGQIGVGGAGRLDVAEQARAERRRDLRTQRQKAGRGCRTGGVHSTNH